MPDPLLKFPIDSRVRYTQSALAAMYEASDLREKAGRLHATVLGRDGDLLLVRFDRHNLILRADPAELETAPEPDASAPGMEPIETPATLWQILLTLLAFAGIVLLILWESRFRLP